MPRQKSRRKSKGRSKSKRRSTKKGQKRKTARRGYKKKSKRKSKRGNPKSKSRRKSKKRSKSKSARSLKQLKAKANRSRQKSRGDMGKCDFGVAPNNECLKNMGKLQGGLRSKYRYNKSPLDGKVLNIKSMDDGQQVVYANLNPKESIVIPMDPDQLEQFFGSSKEVASLKAKLGSSKA